MGAMPGKMIQCLKKVQTENPLVLIDEVNPAISYCLPLIRALNTLHCAVLSDLQLIVVKALLCNS